jgi:hypothetical protein
LQAEDGTIVISPEKGVSSEERSLPVQSVFVTIIPVFYRAGGN